MRIKGKILINVDDIIGKCLGELEVTNYVGFRYDITNGGSRLRHYYLCICSCGKGMIVQRGPLKNNLLHSCGCKSRKGRDKKWQKN